MIIFIYIVVTVAQIFLLSLCIDDSSNNANFFGWLLLFSAPFAVLLLLLAPNKNKFKIFESKFSEVIYCILPFLTFSFTTFACIIFLYKRYYASGLTYLKKVGNKEDLDDWVVYLFKAINKWIYIAFESYDEERKKQEVKLKREEAELKKELEAEAARKKEREKAEAARRKELERAYAERAEREKKVNENREKANALWDDIMQEDILKIPKLTQLALDFAADHYRKNIVKVLQEKDEELASIIDGITTKKVGVFKMRITDHLKKKGVLVTYL